MNMCKHSHITLKTLNTYVNTHPSSTVLTTPKAPQYLAALLGQNGVNVDNIHIDLPPKPGPGIVVSAVDDDDMGLDLSPPPLSPAPSPAPLPAK